MSSAAAPTHQRTEPLAHLALVGVQFAFATLTIAAKYFVLPHVPPTGLVTLRIAGGALVMFALVRATNRQPVSDRKDLARLALYALLGVAVNQMLFIEGLNRTTAINAQVISTSIPAFTLMFGATLGVERFTGRRVFGILLAAAGAIFLIGPDRIELNLDTTVGNTMILINSLSYALFLVLSKPILKRYDSMTVTLWVFLFGLLMVVPFGATSLAQSGAMQTMPWQAWAGIGFIILVPTVGSYLLNAWALKRSDPSMVATYIYLQPLFTGLFAVLLVNERLDPRAIPAAALIFSGVALTTRTRQMTAKELEAENSIAPV